MSSSVHVENKKKYTLTLDEDPTRRLDGTTLTAEKKYLNDCTVTRKEFCLSLHYNGANSYLFVNGAKVHKFNAKDSEILATQLFLGNISKEFFVDNKKKTELNGHVYDFSVDYDSIMVDDILDIYKYLMKNTDMI